MRRADPSECHGVGSMMIAVRRANEPTIPSLAHGDDEVVRWFYEVVMPGQARVAQAPELWTFVSNIGAQRFHERHGFVEVGRTDGDNEEGAPDIRYRWRAESPVTTT